MEGEKGRTAKNLGSNPRQGVGNMLDGISIIVVENPNGQVGVQVVQSELTAREMYGECDRCGVPNSRMTLVTLDYSTDSTISKAESKIMKK